MPPVGGKPIAFDERLLTQDPLQGFTPSHFIHKLSLEAVHIHVQLKKGGNTSLELAAACCCARF